MGAPIRTKDRKDDEAPKRTPSKANAAAPSCAELLEGDGLPGQQLSGRGVENPSRVLPGVGVSAPMRATLRAEGRKPKCKKSKIDAASPVSAKERAKSGRPNCRKSRVKAKAPRWQKLRDKTAKPGCAGSSKGNKSPELTLATRGNKEPRRPQLRRGEDRPKLKKSKTNKKLPDLLKLRGGIKKLRLTGSKTDDVGSGRLLPKTKGETSGRAKLRVGSKSPENKRSSAKSALPTHAGLCARGGKPSLGSRQIPAKALDVGFLWASLQTNTPKHTPK